MSHKTSFRSGFGCPVRIRAVLLFAQGPFDQGPFDQGLCGRGCGIARRGSPALRDVDPAVTAGRCEESGRGLDEITDEVMSHFTGRFIDRLRGELMGPGALRSGGQVRVRRARRFAQVPARAPLAA